MPKGVSKDALANAGIANNLSNQLTANASNIYGSLEPQLAAQAAHPSGYTPGQLASINTAAQQSAGGATAGAVGQGALYAARTRNSGAAPAAIGAATRSAGNQLSQRAVGTAAANANLAQKNQQSAEHALGGLYGTELSGGENALGLSNSALNTATRADEANPWMKLLQSGAGFGNSNWGVKI